VIGETMADGDILLSHPTTGERAFVQVKSAANQAVLDDYIGRFRQYDCQRFFFVCHSPKGGLTWAKGNIHIWTGADLAAMAAKAGLHDWLIERAG
jgi:hypothetical protein